MTLLLSEGYVIAFSDYEGWGTSDPYPFAVLESSAHTMLDDAARRAIFSVRPRAIGSSCSDMALARTRRRPQAREQDVRARP